MKYILAIIFIVLSQLLLAQVTLPVFLQGTWKIEHEERYEHWDLLNTKSMKGLAYTMQHGQMKISEYLEISTKKGDIIYTATLPNQNNGVGIDFKMINEGNSIVFENPEHDFPKKIIYQRLSDSTLTVQVSDGKEKQYSYTMEKQKWARPLIDSSIDNPKYDAVLAKKLGADNYGMKGYVLVILKTGSNATTDTVIIDSCFSGHMENIQRLVKADKLIVAGPLKKNEKSYRGIFILNVTDIDEANILLQSDPAISQGLLGYELFHWYGSAALPEYLPISDKIWKVKP